MADSGRDWCGIKVKFKNKKPYQEAFRKDEYIKRAIVRLAITATAVLGIILNKNIAPTHEPIACTAAEDITYLCQKTKPVIG